MGQRPNTGTKSHMEQRYTNLQKTQGSSVPVFLGKLTGEDRLSTWGWAGPTYEITGSKEEILGEVYGDFKFEYMLWISFAVGVLCPLLATRTVSI